MSHDALIEKALSARTASGRLLTGLSKDEVALAIAHLDGRVTIRQYCAAVNKSNPGSSTHRITAVLRTALQKGWITIKIN